MSIKLLNRTLTISLVGVFVRPTFLKKNYNSIGWPAKVYGIPVIGHHVSAVIGNRKNIYKI